MKLKSILLTTCLTATTLLIQPRLQSQTASPSPSSTPGAPPKFGPEDHPRGGGKLGGEGHRGMRDPEERIAHLKEVLGLTSEQETKIRDIFKAEGDKMRADREANKGSKPDPEERRAKMKAEREKIEAAIKAVLTPEQVTKFEAMKKERKDHGPRPEESPKP
jgi:protein CpxP